MRRQIYRPVLHLGARRVFPKEIVIVPIHRRSNRSRDEPAATIRANISQNAFDAGGTKGTLIGADTRLKRIRRQRLVAMLAGRFEFKHVVLDAKLRVVRNQWFIKLFSVPNVLLGVILMVALVLRRSQVGVPIL